MSPAEHAGVYFSHPACLEHDPRVHMPEHPDTPERLLEEHRVAVAPGEGFGKEGRGWARLSLATADDTLDLGLERLRGALGV